MAVVVERGFAVGVDGVTGWGAGIVTEMGVGEYVEEGIVRKTGVVDGTGMVKRKGFGRGEECCYWEDWRCD